MAIAKAASKIGQFIFRRIRGRLVPIRITEHKVSLANALGNKKFVATTAKSLKQLSIRGKKVPLGRATFYKNNQTNAFEVALIKVRREARGQGIASQLFRNIVKKAEKSGVAKIEGALVHPAMVKIRAKYPTKFYLGSVSDDVLISKKEALKHLSNNKTIDAVTDVNKIRRNKKIIRATSAVGAIGAGATMYRYNKRKRK